MKTISIILKKYEYYLSNMKYKIDKIMILQNVYHTPISILMYDIIIVQSVVVPYIT